MQGIQFARSTTNKGIEMLLKVLDEILPEITISKHYKPCGNTNYIVTVFNHMSLFLLTNCLVEEINR